MDLCKYKTPSGGEVLVAVKRLRPSIIKNKEELHNFVEETKLLRKLQHRCRIARHQACSVGSVLIMLTFYFSSLNVSDFYNHAGT